MIEAVGDRAEVREILCIPAIHFEPLDGFETSVVAYTTDVPAFDNRWGKPFLLGPGSIHVAHTSEERVSKKELLAAQRDLSADGKKASRCHMSTSSASLAKVIAK